MPRRLTNVLAAAAATALCFAGFVGFGFYAAVDDNLGAGFLSFVFMLFMLVGAIWCIGALVIYRRRRVQPRGFAVLTRNEHDGTNRAAGGGYQSPQRIGE